MLRYFFSFHCGTNTTQCGIEYHANIFFGRESVAQNTTISVATNIFLDRLNVVQIPQMQF